jgi:hypothetical protein
MYPLIVKDQYLAYWEGSEFLIQDDFGKVRKYIRYGETCDYLICVPSNQPILKNEPIEGKRVLGHMVTVNYALDGVSIVSQVTLFNNIKYLVSLARNYSGIKRKIKRGHLFIPHSQQIVPLYTD